MFSRLAIVVAFLLVSFASASAVEYCPIKTVPITKFNCEKGLSYVGPRNKFKYGGQCIYPLQGCIAKVEDTNDDKCQGGTFVGSPKAAKFGGQCLFPADGWKIEVRAAKEFTDCKSPEVYMGAAKKGTLDGHCVKISK